MDSLAPLQQYRVFLERWGIWLTVLVTEKGMYFVLGELCDALGIADRRQQYQQLLSHESASEFIERLPVQTDTRGRQRAYCIHQEILGGWLFMVNPKLLRLEFRTRLVQFQREARHALNRIIFGEVESTAKPLDNKPQSATIIKLSDWLGKPQEPIQLLSPDNED